MSDEPVTVDAEALTRYLTRIENLETQKKAIGADIKTVYDEAKNEGIDTKALRKLVTERRADESARRHLEDVLEAYRDAVGPR